VLGIIPQGFTILAGPPKAGKSWLVLSILLAVSSGRAALGRIVVTPGRTLYLALEDSDARMQDRCRSLVGEDQRLPKLFNYKTKIQPGLILETVRAFLAKYPETRLVVIDTLGKVMPPAIGNETTYQRDYRVGGALKRIADDYPGLALVVNHHDRKAGATDFVERVSGTNGLTGAADTVIVLSRERNSQEGTLSVTGRDVEENEYAIFTEDGSWRLDGTDLTDASNNAVKRAATENIGELMKELVSFIDAQEGPVTAKEVSENLKIEPGKAYVYLGRAVAAGTVQKVQRGTYKSVRSVRKDADQSNLTHLTVGIGEPEARLW
jgi:predicted ATP-dependent serine protease